MNNQLEKASAVAQTVIETAEIIAQHAKELPSTRKRLRLTYNRRPMKKKKTALALLKMSITQSMARMRIATIISQPVPKFPIGGA